MFLVLKKTPKQINDTNSGLCERISFKDKEEFINALHAELGPVICKVRHPTIDNVIICYSQNSKAIGNFRLSYSGDWLHGAVYFVKSNGEQLTEELCNKIISSIKRYIITKEYIAGAKNGN